MSRVLLTRRSPSAVFEIAEQLFRVFENAIGAWASSSGPNLVRRELALFAEADAAKTLADMLHRGQPAPARRRNFDGRSQEWVAAEFALGRSKRKIYLGCVQGYLSGTGDT